jgi:hypothetical protein
VIFYLHLKTKTTIGDGEDSHTFTSSKLRSSKSCVFSSTSNFWRTTSDWRSSSFVWRWDSARQETKTIIQTIYLTKQRRQQRQDQRRRDEMRKDQRREEKTGRDKTGEKRKKGQEKRKQGRSTSFIGEDTISAFVFPKNKG